MSLKQAKQFLIALKKGRINSFVEVNNVTYYYFKNEEYEFLSRDKSPENKSSHVLRRLCKYNKTTGEMIAYNNSNHIKWTIVIENKEEKNVPCMLGIKEVCELKGWEYPKNRSMVDTYRKRHLIPEPVQTLACGPIWIIDQFKDSHS